RSTAVHFIWNNDDVDALLASVERALGGTVGDWSDDDGELTGLAGLKSADGLNLATYWKAGFLASVEPLGLAIDRATAADGSRVLSVVAVIPPSGSPLAKGKQGLIQIARMPGSTWAPFGGMGAARLQVDFVDPQ